MRCLWKGSLLNIVDNIKLCAIVDRLHFWAINYLRPWLSGCIDHRRRSAQLIRDEGISQSDEESVEGAESGDDKDEDDDYDDDNGNYSDEDDTITFRHALRRARTIDNFAGTDEVDDTEEYDSDEEEEEEEGEEEEEKRVEVRLNNFSLLGRHYRNNQQQAANGKRRDG